MTGLVNGALPQRRRSRELLRPCICDIERPPDLEALEDGKDLVVYLEPFTHRLPGEIASMGIEPPLACAVAFALVPSKCLIDLGQRLNRYLGRPTTRRDPELLPMSRGAEPLSRSACCTRRECPVTPTDSKSSRGTVA